MEVQFQPAVQEMLDQIARESGVTAADLVQDAVAGYLAETAEIRQMIDTRYDDIKSGKVKLIPGEEIEEYFRRKREAMLGISPAA